jgi:ABC-type nitrate/sulfonate/bicarbonate transport system substrate-binding protein
MGTMLWLEHLGLDAQKDDIRFLVIGDQTLLAQGLESGTIDAANLDGSFSRKLRQRGFSVLTDASKVNLPIVSQGIVVTAEYLRKQPRVVEGVLQALIEGLAFTVAPANKPLVLKTLAKKLGVMDPTAGRRLSGNPHRSGPQALPISRGHEKYPATRTIEGTAPCKHQDREYCRR